MDIENHRTSAASPKTALPAPPACRRATADRCPSRQAGLPAKAQADATAIGSTSSRTVMRSRSCKTPSKTQPASRHMKPVCRAARQVMKADQYYLSVDALTQPMPLGEKP